MSNRFRGSGRDDNRYTLKKSNRSMNTTVIHYKVRTTGPIIGKVIAASPTNDPTVVETPRAG